MKNWVVRGLLAVAVLFVAYGVWTLLRPSGLPAGIVGGNGRLEATEIDVSTQSAGRIRDILVDEGDTVTAGQIIAHMDSDTLQAQRNEALAQLAEAKNAVQIAETQVAQRRSEKASALAVVRQREAELNASRRRFERSETLAREGATAMQERDDNQAQVEGASATVAAARAQLDSADAAIVVASNQVIGARSRVEATQATIQRIDANIADNILRAPRDGRVQYRVAQPGEVLAPGGRVVSLVDLTDVTMTFFLPATEAGRLAIGGDARIMLDAAPNFPIPATISFVADVAQFTPKTIETQSEREKMVFRVKARIDPALLRKYITQVKNGLPGMAYVRLSQNVAWPANLQPKPSAAQP
jgi:HlyD family secretion protein